MLSASFFSNFRFVFFNSFVASKFALFTAGCPLSRWAVDVTEVRYYFHGQNGEQEETELFLLFYTYH